MRMQHHYRRLGAELLADFLVMFTVMYAMIDSADHAFLNSNNLYMTLMMVSPMALIMLFSMRHMFSNQKLNLILYSMFALIFALSFFAMRTQALVGDRQFLRAMIPHHSGALLMCAKAKLADPEIIALCDKIEASQNEEINQMKSILKRL